MKWLLLILIVAACAKKNDEAPATNNDPAVPEAEIKRGQDACKAYVDKACACAATVEAAKVKCSEAPAFGEVLAKMLELSMSKDSSPKDVKQSAMTIRKTIAECIQQTAALPTLGCPP